MIPLASSALTRRRHADGESDPAVLLEPGHDGTINSVWQMFRHRTQLIGDCAQFCVV